MGFDRLRHLKINLGDVGYNRVWVITAIDYYRVVSEPIDPEHLYYDVRK